MSEYGVINLIRFSQFLLDKNRTFKNNQKQWSIADKNKIYGRLDFGNEKNLWWKKIIFEWKILHKKRRNKCFMKIIW